MFRQDIGPFETVPFQFQNGSKTSSPILVVFISIRSTFTWLKQFIADEREKGHFTFSFLWYEMDTSHALEKKSINDGRCSRPFSHSSKHLEFNIALSANHCKPNRSFCCSPLQIQPCASSLSQPSSLWQTPARYPWRNVTTHKFASLVTTVTLHVSCAGAS